MNITIKYCCGSLCAVLLVGGCASVPEPASFENVAIEIQQRTGQEPVWRQSDADDQAVEAEVRSLLEDGLALNEALRVALINNHGLQATYEDLGVAQARRLQAELISNPIFDLVLLFPGLGD